MGNPGKDDLNPMGIAVQMVEEVQGFFRPPDGKSSPITATVGRESRYPECEENNPGPA